MSEKRNDQPDFGKFAVGLITTVGVGFFSWTAINALQSPGTTATEARDASISVRQRADQFDREISNIESDLASVRDRLDRSERILDRFKESLAYGTRFSKEDADDLLRYLDERNRRLERELEVATLERQRIEKRIDNLLEFVSKQYQEQH